MKDFICFGVLNWLKSKVDERDSQYFWGYAKLSWWGQIETTQVKRCLIFPHVKYTCLQKKLGCFWKFLPAVVYHKKSHNATQGSGFSETIDWNCFVFSLDASVGWCKVQQLDRKICTLQHTNECYTRFYKNNFIRTMRPKPAQKLRTITCSISLQVFL